MSNQISHPESQMMTYGYDPKNGQGAVKAPLYQASTFVFNTAEEGKQYFEWAYGISEPSKENETQSGLIYSRLNNPNLDLFEQRLSLWDKAEQAAVFESGMAAISTVFLDRLKPGDILLYSSPTYGGTDHFINHFLPTIGVESIGFSAEDSQEEIIEKVEKSGGINRLALIYIETPANPTNALIDISLCRKLADYFSSLNNKEVLLAVDNTYMGPIWSQPLKHGADLVIYSATKYIGGHSDLIAGAVLGNSENMVRIKTLRTFLGNMASPHTCWLLLRSLETLKVRMEQQMQNAIKVAEFLNSNKLVKDVFYLNLLEEGTAEYSLYKKQYSAPGAMLSFTINGGEKEAFKVINALKLIKLAVSLGSTESLVQHPASMTHVAMNAEEREALGVTDNLIRLSVGLENSDDLINDLQNGLNNLISKNNCEDQTVEILLNQELALN